MSFDLDDFQREITAAENYLRSSAAAIRVSTTAPRDSVEGIGDKPAIGAQQPQLPADPSALTETDSSERERLVQRLLDDYNRRKSGLAGQGYGDSGQEPEEEKGSVMITFSSSQTLPRSQSEDSMAYAASTPVRSEVAASPRSPHYASHIFFASDPAELADDMAQTVAWRSAVDQPASESVMGDSPALTDSIPERTQSPAKSAEPRSDRVPLNNRRNELYAQHALQQSDDQQLGFPHANRNADAKERTAAKEAKGSRRGRSRSVSAGKKRSMEELEKQVEREFHATHTFHPRLFTQSSAGGPKKPPRRSVEAQEKHVASMTMLHQRALKKREMIRNELQQAELLNCTFRPKIYSVSPDGREVKGDFVADVSERLHREARQRSRYLHELAASLEQVELAECTFQPAIKRRPDDSDERRPIHERVADLQRERQRYLFALREDREKEQSQIATFKPQIDEKSRKIAEKWWCYEHDDLTQQARALALHTDVGSRLLSEGRRLARRRQTLAAERDEELAATMQPAGLSKGTKQLEKMSALVSADFHTRQHQYHKRRQRSQTANRQQLEADYESWFKPKIEEKTIQILCQTRPEVVTEGPTSRAHRMSYIEALRLANKRKALEAKLYSNLSFTPAISATAQKKAVPSTYQELHDNDKAKIKQDRIRRQVEEEQARRCTFTPAINRHSERLLEEGEDYYALLHKQYFEEFLPAEDLEQISPSGTEKKIKGRINLSEPEAMAKDIRLHLRKKEEERRNQLIAREIEELQECTFQPMSFSTSYYHNMSQHSESGSPVVVAGLGRHMELQQMAKRLKEEARQREEEAFKVKNVDMYRRPEDGLTIVKGFHFRLESPSRRMARQRYEAKR